MNVLLPHLDQIKNLCHEHRVASLFLFGSATGNHINELSDIDFLVKFKPIDLSEYFSNYLSFKNGLKVLLNREVDLVEEQTLKNPVLIKSINQSKELIYG